MFNFGTASEAHLVGVHPDLVRIARHAIAVSTQDFTVLEGLRSIEQQRINVAKGVSKTMDSKHLKQTDGFGHAVDLVPVLGGKPRWEWPLIYPVALAMHNAAMAENVNLRWGGVWDKLLRDLPGTIAGLTQSVHDYCVRHPGPDFLDGPHFELHA